MFIPRLLATILLLTCIAMLWPIVSAVIAISGGAAVPTAKWAVPLTILATGAIMSWLLTRKAVSLQLYIAAFALWVITAGYFFVVAELR
jgi:hypothetical protein